MDLIRDLLDKRIVDRNGRDLGRVDSVVLEVRDGAPPTVAAIEIGLAVLGHRVLPVLGRLAEALEHALGIEDGRPVRIPFALVLGIEDNIKLDVAFGDTPAGALELRLRRWVSALPGSS